MAAWRLQHFVDEWLKWECSAVRLSSIGFIVSMEVGFVPGLVLHPVRSNTPIMARFRSSRTGASCVAVRTTELTCSTSLLTAATSTTTTVRECNGRDCFQIQIEAMLHSSTSATIRLTFRRHVRSIPQTPLFSCR